jgi:hypothetical protein
MTRRGRLPSDWLPGDPIPAGCAAPLSDHWTAARREEVLRRLDEGEIGLNDALRRWNLTLEEVERWRASHQVYGRRGLRMRQLARQPQGRLL